MPADDQALRVFAPLAERVRQLLLREADEAGLPAHERPQKVILLPESLSEEAGTLTKGLKKVVPGEVVKRYHQTIEAAVNQRFCRGDCVSAALWRGEVCEHISFSKINHKDLPALRTQSRNHRLTDARSTARDDILARHAISAV